MAPASPSTPYLDNIQSHQRNRKASNPPRTFLSKNQQKDTRKTPASSEKMKQLKGNTLYSSISIPFSCCRCGFFPSALSTFPANGSHLRRLEATHQGGRGTSRVRKEPSSKSKQKTPYNPSKPTETTSKLTETTKRTPFSFPSFTQLQTHGETTQIASIR